MRTIYINYTILSSISVDDSATETDIRIAIRKEAENLNIAGLIDDVDWSEKRW